MKYIELVAGALLSILLFGCQPLDSTAEDEGVVAEASQALDPGAGNVDFAVAFCTEQVVVKDQARLIARHDYPGAQALRLGRVAALGHRAAGAGFGALSPDVTHEHVERVQIKSGQIVVDCGPAFNPFYDFVTLLIPNDGALYRSKVGPDANTDVSFENHEVIKVPELGGARTWKLTTPTRPKVVAIIRSCFGAHPHQLTVHAFPFNVVAFPQCNNVRGVATILFDGTKFSLLSWSGNVVPAQPPP